MLLVANIFWQWSHCQAIKMKWHLLSSYEERQISFKDESQRTLVPRGKGIYIILSDLGTKTSKLKYLIYDAPLHFQTHGRSSLGSGWSWVDRRPREARTSVGPSTPPGLRCLRYTRSFVAHGPSWSPVTQHTSHFIASVIRQHTVSGGSGEYKWMIGKY